MGHGDACVAYVKDDVASIVSHKLEAPGKCGTFQCGPVDSEAQSRGSQDGKGRVARLHFAAHGEGEGEGAAVSEGDDGEAKPSGTTVKKGGLEA